MTHAVVSLLVAGVFAAGTPDSAEKYTLRYKFQPGETARWNVAHRCRIRTTVSDSTQLAETTTTSVKVWRVDKVSEDGTAVFVHSVESVDMRHRLSGRDEVHYNSATNPVPPKGFEHLAQSVGVPLTVVTMDRLGKIVHRDRKVVKAAVASEGEMTIRLPQEPVAVGARWSFPHDVEIPLPSGGVHKLKALQTMSLVEVKTGVATINVNTEILSPLHDPALESQVMQFLTSGTVRFDIDAGRVLSQQLEVDRNVVGFRGEASSIHYASRFSEELVRSAARVAAK
jgi:hypothetical protein